MPLPALLVEPIVTTQATTASVLESSLRPVRAQLDLAIEQTRSPKHLLKH
ncbi:TPA: hypothetical protein U5E38_004068 [Yersinia enterocolitica]|nr:hypothetical protein [Yersinia enterocolitica]HEO0719422.1 hypothetical protein [Yersinia enterocolitica]